MKQHIEDSQKKFRAFSNETLDDYHGERAFVYTEPALETALTTFESQIRESERERMRKVVKDLLPIMWSDNPEKRA